MTNHDPHGRAPDGEPYVPNPARPGAFKTRERLVEVLLRRPRRAIVTASADGLVTAAMNGDRVSTADVLAELKRSRGGR